MNRTSVIFPFLSRVQTEFSFCSSSSSHRSKPIARRTTSAFEMLDRCLSFASFSAISAGKTTVTLSFLPPLFTDFIMQRPRIPAPWRQSRSRSRTPALSSPTTTRRECDCGGSGNAVGSSTAGWAAITYPQHVVVSNFLWQYIYDVLVLCSSRKFNRL